MSKNILSVATLIGVVIGAGIFTLPYAIAKAGLGPGLFYLLILGGATLLVNLFLGEVVLRTQEKHRLVGYAKKYLGDSGERLILVAVVLGAIGTLLAYIAMAGEFLALLFSLFLEIPSFWWSLVFWLVLSYLVFQGIKMIARVELFTNLGFFAIVFLIFVLGFSRFQVQNLSLFNPEYVFLPYGLILFAFAGASAIPEISEILKSPKQRKGFIKVIIFSQVLIFFFYLFFALGITGVSGENTSKEALAGLVPFLGPKIIFLGALAAAITLADSFLVIALSLRNTLIYDYKFKRVWATLWTCGLPLGLFLLGFNNFIVVIGLVGAVVGAVEGIAILLIFKRAKTLGDRKPEYQIKAPSFLICLLMLIFILGAITEILY